MPAPEHKDKAQNRGQPVMAYIALGSNLGDRRAILEKAADLLRSDPDLKVSKVSSFYQTEPVGGPKGQSPYLNGVVEVATALSPAELLDRLLLLEQRLGRKRRRRWGPRCIDLDLLLYGQEVISRENLTVPHPLMHQREFVLRGLAQVAPQTKHPTLGLTARQMWEQVSTEH